MSSNNLSQGGAKRLKGTSKENEDKELSGKDEKTKEEIKKEEPKDVNYKGPVLEPLYKPFPSIIKFLYNGKNEVLTPEAGAVDDFYVQMIDERCRAMKASLYKKTYESLKEVMDSKQKAKFIKQRNCGFSSVHKHLADLRKDKKQEEAEPLPEGVNVKKEAVKTYPSSIEFSYQGKIEVLKPEAAKVVAFYKSLVEHEYTPGIEFSNKIFKHLKEATDEEKKQFKDLNMFDFSYLLGYFREQADLRKEMTEGEKDWMKYETARKLKKRLPKIRDAYKKDWESEKKRIRQQGVALYFIDTLALRVGNHKPHSKKKIADTVGCCSLGVEHIKLHEEDEGQEFVVEFNFPGKNSIQFERKITIEETVFKNIQEFLKEAKEKDHELFHLVKPHQLNTYLKTHMPGLTTKVFRTCHASITLQDKLKELTDEAEKTVTRTPEERLALMLEVHRQAFQAAALLCNHLHATPKTSDEQMAKLKDKIKTLETDKERKKQELKSVKNEEKPFKSKKKKQKQLVEGKRKVDENLKEAQSAEGCYASNVTTTIKYYLDPRITVAWCKKWEVPVEEIYSPALMQKFKWAIDMAEDLLDYEF